MGLMVVAVDALLDMVGDARRRALGRDVGPCCYPRRDPCRAQARTMVVPGGNWRWAS